VVALARPVRGDVPIGDSVTISGEGSVTWTTDPNGRNNAPDSPLVPFNAYLFGSWSATPRLTIYASGHGQSGSGAELLGAFGRWNVDGASHVTVDFGRIPVPFGTFPARVTPFRNPLIDYPLMYGYPVSLRADYLPENRIDLLLHGSGSGYTAHVFGDNEPGYGIPMIAPYPYDVGASVRLHGGSVSLTAALVGGPLSESHDYTERLGRTVVGRLEWNPDPAWRAGLSYARGPYLEADAAEDLAPGLSLLSQYQTLTGADLSFSRGPWQVVAEFGRSRWDVASLGQALGVSSWYVEARYKVEPGLFVSGRWSRMTFDSIETGVATLPSRLSWDADVSRLELGAGWYLSRDVLIKGEVESQQAARGDQRDVRSFTLSVNGRF
jgi:hypothetical protein